MRLCPRVHDVTRPGGVAVAHMDAGYVGTVYLCLGRATLVLSPHDISVVTSHRCRALYGWAP